MQRIITGLVLATAMALLVFLASESVFRAALAGIGMLAAVEMRRLTQKLAAEPGTLCSWFAAVAARWRLGSGAGYRSDAHAFVLLLFLFGVLPAVAALLTSRGGVAERDPQHAPVAASLLCFGVAYLASAVVALAGLHAIDPLAGLSRRSPSSGRATRRRTTAARRPESTSWHLR